MQLNDLLFTLIVILLAVTTVGVIWALWSQDKKDEE
jgi:heme/copper-type cytochrome/quinol oxidase subunit 4